MATLQLPEAVRAHLRSVVRAGYPHETCGLLLGQAGPDGVRVEEALAAENLNRERPGDRYDLDPQGHLRAEERARALGLTVVGVWHSHPDHPAEPSETDRNGAWEGWSYLILSVTAEGVPDLRSWRLRGEHFEEEDLQRPQQLQEAYKLIWKQPTGFARLAIQHGYDIIRSTGDLRSRYHIHWQCSPESKLQDRCSGDRRGIKQ